MHPSTLSFCDGIREFLSMLLLLFIWKRNNHDVQRLQNLSKELFDPFLLHDPWEFESGYLRQLPILLSPLILLLMAPISAGETRLSNSSRSLPLRLHQFKKGRGNPS